MTGWGEIVERAKILVVEDDPATRKFLESLLERVGYKTIRSTGDARAAVQMYWAMDPDLVLLDLHMEGVKGFELLERLSSQSDPQGFTPILMITGDVAAETKLNALLSGATDFITKPLDTVEAMLRIRILLETRFKFKAMEHELAELRVSRP